MAGTAEVEALHFVKVIGPRFAPVANKEGSPDAALVKLKLLPGMLITTRASFDNTALTAVEAVSVPHTPLTVQPASDMV